MLAGEHGSSANKGETLLVAEASLSVAEKTPIDVKWVQDKKDRDAKYVEAGFKVVLTTSRAGRGKRPVRLVGAEGAEEEIEVGGSVYGRAEFRFIITNRRSMGIFDAPASRPNLEDGDDEIDSSLPPNALGPPNPTCTVGHTKSTCFSTCAGACTSHGIQRAHYGPRPHQRNINVVLRLQEALRLCDSDIELQDVAARVERTHGNLAGLCGNQKRRASGYRWAKDMERKKKESEAGDPTSKPDDDRVFRFVRKVEPEPRVRAPNTTIFLHPCEVLVHATGQ
ncbi:hypothetical protein B0H13DRAFT_1883246 [Mycena leptocephala]|nr:hypothetical protein B0H13DRAFT_1883246 [Mycena leptocephala]